MIASTVLCFFIFPFIRIGEGGLPLLGHAPRLCSPVKERQTTYTEDECANTRSNAPPPKTRPNLADSRWRV